MAGPHTDYVKSLIYNGKSTPALAASGILPRYGCPYRGTTTCHSCPLGVWIPIECEYNCFYCEYRKQCFCGWDQSRKLQSLGVISME